jgi:hypothetical protein
MMLPLKIAASTSYKAKALPPSARAAADDRPLAEIRRVHAANYEQPRRTYRATVPVGRAGCARHRYRCSGRPAEPYRRLNSTLPLCARSLR